MISKPNPIRAVRLSALLILSGAASLLANAPSYAQQSPAQTTSAEAPKLERKLSKKAKRLIAEAQEHLEYNAPTAALMSLEAAAALPDLNPYETSLIYMMMGAIQVKRRHMNEARDSFVAALEAGGLSAAEADTVQTDIANLNKILAQFDVDIQDLKTRIDRGEDTDGLLSEELMQVYVLSGQPALALPLAEAWFADLDVKEEKHFNVMFVVYDKLGMLSEQAAIARDMAARWPDNKKYKKASKILDKELKRSRKR